VNKRTRFASPVITKAIKVNGKWRPLLMVLSSPHAWQCGPLQLQNAGDRPVDRTRIELTSDQRRFCPPYAHAPVGMPPTDAPIREALVTYVASLPGWKLREGGLP
jgi:hypothetical protein